MQQVVPAQHCAALMALLPLLHGGSVSGGGADVDALMCEETLYGEADICRVSYRYAYRYGH
jgi:hypothetical protein